MKRFVAPVLLVALVATLLIQLPLAIADRTSIYEWFDPIVDVRTLLVERYVEPIDEETEMPRAMIDAMLETLDDPYTQYIPPANLREFNKQLRGTYAGIGAEVNQADGYLVIVSPMDDSPALRAGVMAGDVVLEIEGESTFDQPLTDSVEKLTGEAGTPVSIRVRHLDDTEESLTIVRDHIVTRTVKGLRRFGEGWSYCIDPNLGLSYIRVTQFNEATVEELRDALRTRQTEGGLNGLILDLRDNPGGGLPTAVDMANLFLSEGTIVSVRPRVGREAVYTARPASTLPDFPMIVMVNGASASASEIIAGSLQDNGRAIVLGTRTYGKGSVQEVRALPYNRGTLKLTTAHYYLPSGRNINRKKGEATWGVDPTPGFVVPVSDEDYLASFRARREFEIIRAPADDFEPCVDGPWIREHLLDEPLARAVTALRARAEGGDWPDVGEADAGVIAMEIELERAFDRRTRLIEELHRTEATIDELQAVAGEEDDPLLPPELDLTDGTITLHDRDGKQIGVYRIDAGDVSLALGGMRLAPVPASEPETAQP
ncbi:MAG: S41 family peptidase [Phycisphaerales bacterium]|nr:S41 family peptidase [Phycisphaerae bacterium]NNF44260.1 S41 family peptidase [Phycisphaerales bacterium]NNM26916.1 S41 family peptidase [Phycisphaerales bacterium]